MRWSRAIVPVFAVGSFAVAGRYLAGRYPERFDPVVACSQGYRYRAIWVPGGSLTGLRWFHRRFPCCPVGRHGSWIRRLDTAQLSPAEVQAAGAVHDLRVV